MAGQASSAAGAIVGESHDPVFQISYASGGSTVSTAGSRQLDALRNSFERDHHALLPRLLSAETFDRVQRDMGEGEFTVREHKGLSTELCMETGKAAALLMFLMDDPDFFWTGVCDSVPGVRMLRAGHHPVDASVEATDAIAAGDRAHELEETGKGQQ